jgi:S1-C subfamily serine protease
MFEDSPDTAGSAQAQSSSSWPGPGGQADSGHPGYPAGGYPGYPGYSGYSGGFPGGPGDSYPGGPGGGYPGYPGGYAGGGYPGYPGGPGGGYPGHPGYPGQPGGGAPGGPHKRRHGVRALALTAVAAMAIGAGTTWALTAGSGSGPVLTTDQVVQKTDPGIVDVISTLSDQGAMAYGTGVVLTPDGEILTNNHVINGATSLKVRDVGNGRTYSASVVGYSQADDVAVIQLKNASGLRTATLGDSGTVSVGNKVVAIGNAGGQDGTPSVATGRVTALNQAITASDEGSGFSEKLTGLIQTNANIQPGDSGGPLTNVHGQVIGLDTAASTGSSWQFSSASPTQAYTVPINEALSVAKQIEAGTSSSTVHVGATGFLGVEVSSSGALPGAQGGSSGGAQVAGVVPGSAVASTGIAAGDTITSLAGHTISSTSDIRTVLERYHPGDKIGISWTSQGGGSHSATIVLGSGPAA